MKEDTYLRPDASGNRGGVDRKPQQSGDDYPYDKQTSYGQPAIYDRGSGTKSTLRRPLTPKSAWEELEEAIGTPMFFQKAYSSQRGSSVAGAAPSAAWSHPPSHAWDENQKEDELEKFGEAEAPPFEPVPPHIELRDPNVEDPSHEIFLVQAGAVSPTPEDLVTQILSSMGLLPQHSVWPFLEKMMRVEENEEN